MKKAYNRLLWLTAVVAGMILLIVLVWMIPWEKRDPLRKLWAEDIEARRQVFWNVIHTNGMRGLPEELLDNPSTEPVKVEAERLRLETEGIVTFIHAMYNVGGRGTRGVTLLLDEKGDCFFWSRDRIWNRFFTGSLFYEGGKVVGIIVQFPEEDEEFGGRRRPDRLQVFALETDGPQKILDVIYNMEASPGEEGDLTYRVPSEAKGSSILALEDMHFHPVVEFVWDASRGRFVWQGTPSTNWRVLYPVSDESNREETQGH